MEGEEIILAYYKKEHLKEGQKRGEMRLSLLRCLFLLTAPHLPVALRSSIQRDAFRGGRNQVRLFARKRRRKDRPHRPSPAPELNDSPSSPQFPNASIGDDTAAEMSDTLFEIPDVQELEAKRLARVESEKKAAESSVIKSTDSANRIRRKDIDELRNLLELDPTADMQDDMFQSEYDITSMVLGEAGKPFLGFIQPAYLQITHLILLATSIVCAFVEYPGNPLTELPVELRDFLKSGLAIICSINVVLAGISVPVSVRKGQPAVFWFIKTSILGGLAFSELRNAPNKS